MASSLVYQNDLQVALNNSNFLLQFQLNSLTTQLSSALLLIGQLQAQQQTTTTQVSQMQDLITKQNSTIQDLQQRVSAAASTSFVSATYLTKADAAAIYLTQANASNSALLTQVVIYHFKL